MKNRSIRRIWIITAVFVLGYFVIIAVTFRPNSDRIKHNASLASIKAHGGAVRNGQQRHTILAKLTRPVFKIQPPVADVQLGELSDFDDDALAEILGISEMEVLELQHTAITDKGIFLITEANLANLRAIHLSGTAITDNGLAKLATLPSLTDLTLSHCSGITDEGIREFRPLCTHFVRIHR